MPGIQDLAAAARGARKLADVAKIMSIVKKIQAANTQGMSNAGVSNRGGGGSGGGGGGSAAPVSTLAGLPQTPLLKEMIDKGLIKEGMPPEQALAILQFGNLGVQGKIDAKALLDMMNQDYSRYTGDITTSATNWMNQLYGQNFGMPEGFQYTADQRAAMGMPPGFDLTEDERVAQGTTMPANWDYKNGTWYDDQGVARGTAATEDAAINPIAQPDPSWEGWDYNSQGQWTNPAGQVMGTSPQEDMAISPMDANTQLAMRDPIFSQYAGDLAGLQETSDLNRTTDIEWIRKNEQAYEDYLNAMATGISTGTIPIGAGAGGGGGGGGGGRGGRGGYGGGGGGGGGGDWSNTKTTLSAEEELSSTATDTYYENFPGFIKSLLGTDPETGELILPEGPLRDRIEGILNTAPSPEEATAALQEEMEGIDTDVQDWNDVEASNEQWGTLEPARIRDLFRDMASRGLNWGVNDIGAPSFTGVDAEGKEMLPEIMMAGMSPEEQDQFSRDRGYLTDLLNAGNAGQSTIPYTDAAGVLHESMPAPLYDPEDVANKIINPIVYLRDQMLQQRQQAGDPGGNGVSAGSGTGPMPGEQGINTILDAINGQGGTGAVNQANAANSLAEQAVGGISNAVNAVTGGLSNMFQGAEQNQPPTQFNVQLPPNNTPQTPPFNADPNAMAPAARQSFEQLLQNIFPNGTGPITPGNYGGGPRQPTPRQLNQIHGTIPQLPASPTQMPYPGQPGYYHSGPFTPEQINQVHGTTPGGMPTPPYQYGPTMGEPQQTPPYVYGPSAPQDPWAQYGGANNLGDITSTPDPNASSGEFNLWELLGGGSEQDANDPTQVVGGAGNSMGFMAPAFNAGFNPIMQVLAKARLQGRPTRDPVPPTPDISQALAAAKAIQQSQGISRLFNATRQAQDAQSVASGGLSSEWQGVADDIDWDPAAIQGYATTPDIVRDDYQNRLLFNQEGGLNEQPLSTARIHSLNERNEQYGPLNDEELANLGLSNQYYQLHPRGGIQSQEEADTEAAIASAIPTVQEMTHLYDPNWTMAQTYRKLADIAKNSISLTGRATTYADDMAGLTSVGLPNERPFEDIDIGENPPDYPGGGGTMGSGEGIKPGGLGGLDIAGMMRASAAQIAAKRAADAAPKPASGGWGSHGAGWRGNSSAQQGARRVATAAQGASKLAGIAKIMAALRKIQGG